MLKGEVFGRQLFENQIFALFINTFLNGNNGVCDNYLNGMAVTYSGSNITVDSGAVCIQGRFLEEDTSTTLDAGTNNLYCKLIIEIDLDKVNTEDSFNQAYYKIVSDSTGYPELTQTDIVGTNSGVYQYEFARFRTTVSGITDFQDMRTFLDFDSIYDEIRRHIEDIDDGSIFALKSQIQANILYTNPGDSRENPVLNDDITKYKRVDIQYSDGTVKNAISFYDVKVGDQLQLDIWAAVRDQTHQLRYAFATMIVDTERTIVYRDYLAGFVTGSEVTYWSVKDVKIDMIIGYKEY